ncbi:flagellar basal body protein [Herbaspirillum sp. WGmk3]|uniref:flagellar basal body rod protein FlgB n=1 Tax=Herbaspirillum sp. WGmk3 TaxID=2919925 RepID=UPI00209122A3|nr:flagellar basal body protein [Herbaspirillum sp. WGmk3]MCO4855936.1 flagellar basal body protein [Herbaspirillum sp. WGmk3]
MSNAIESITTTALGLALDAASQRQQVIATNIANAGTVGYTPVRLGFADQMQDLQRRLDAGLPLDSYSLAAFQTRMTPVLDANNQPAKVQLDEEVVMMSQNSVQYQALVRGLSRHLSILGMAASDGKR